MGASIVRWGVSGSRIVCVHGSLSAGEAAFGEQKVMSEAWRLSVLYRRGYGPNPPIEGVDVATDADDVAAALEDGAHLVGTSMGGVVSMIAAAKRPQAVKSLTLIEPPAFALARDLAAVDRDARAMQAHWRECSTDDLRTFAMGFLGAIGVQMELPDPLPQPMQQAIRNLTTERPWRVDVPIGAIADAPFPTIVVTGGWSAAFEQIGDRIAAISGAQRHIIRGAGHAVQRVGKTFNQVLSDFLTSVESAQ